VPVASALEAAPYNANIFSQKYVNGTNQNFPSTSQTFIAQETNAGAGTTNNVHIRFTARNSRWLFNEMENLPNLENCSGECSNPFYITGTTPICTTGTYRLPVLQRGATVTWSASPSGIVTLTPSGQQVTVNKIINGTVTLTATISNGCVGTPPITTSLNVGDPTTSATILGSDCVQQLAENYTLTTSNPCSSCTYSWSLLNNGTGNATSYSATITYQDENFCTVYGGASGGANAWHGYSLACTIYNACSGVNTTVYKPFKVTPRGGLACGSGFSSFSSTSSLKVSPNPSASTITVESLDAFTFRKLIIYDKVGNVKRIVNLPNETVSTTINISDLPTDIYQIQAFNGTEWKTLSFNKL
jgi:hypothetical protein